MKIFTLIIIIITLILIYYIFDVNEFFGDYIFRKTVNNTLKENFEEKLSMDNIADIHATSDGLLPESDYNMPADFNGFNPNDIKNKFGESSLSDPSVSDPIVANPIVANPIVANPIVANPMNDQPGIIVDITTPPANLGMPSPVIFNPRSIYAPSSNAPSSNAPSSNTPSSNASSSNILGASNRSNAQYTPPTSSNQIYKYTYNIEIDSELSQDYIINKLKDIYSTQLKISQDNIIIILSRTDNFTNNNSKYEYYSTINWNVDLTINGSNNNSIIDVITKSPIGHVTDLKNVSNPLSSLQGPNASQTYSTTESGPLYIPTSKVIIPSGSTIVYTTSDNIVSYKRISSTLVDNNPKSKIILPNTETSDTRALVINSSNIPTPPTPPTPTQPIPIPPIPTQPIPPIQPISYIAPTTSLVDIVPEKTSSIIMPSNVDPNEDVTDDDDVYDTIGGMIASPPPKPITLLGRLSNVEKPIVFALYTLIKKSYINSNNTITESDPEKVYLTVANSTNNYSLCNLSSGMLTLNPTLTKGALFKLYSEYKYFPKQSSGIKSVYDHLDYESIENEQYKSLFYKLNVFNSNYNVTYCAENCSDPVGFCAQQKNDITKNINYTSYTNGYFDTDKKIPKVDTYNIKNYIKFKVESESKKIVTPYFLSMNPSQNIYFITNRVANVNYSDDYYNLSTVPIYPDSTDGEQPYYKYPVYREDNNNINRLIYDKVTIHDINHVYTSDELKEYGTKKQMLSEETFAFKNDAYEKYALQFYIEELTDDQANNM